MLSANRPNLHYVPENLSSAHSVHRKSTFNNFDKVIIEKIDKI